MHKISNCLVTAQGILNNKTGVWAFIVNRSLTGEFLISCRNSERAESACCLISWLESLSILNKPEIHQGCVSSNAFKEESSYQRSLLVLNNDQLPSRKSGRKPSISISGTLSNTVIQPTKNCRT